MSQSDDDCPLYTLVNEVTGACDGTISLEAIPTLSSLLKLEELSVDELDHSLKNWGFFRGVGHSTLHHRVEIFSTFG